MAAPHQTQPPVSAVMAAPPAAPMAPPLRVLCWVSFMPAQPASPRLKTKTAASAPRLQRTFLISPDLLRARVKGTVVDLLTTGGYSIYSLHSKRPAISSNEARVLRCPRPSVMAPTNAG